MIVLIGLRGAGKTSAGRLFAARAMRPFADLDEVIARDAGRPPAELLAESEPRFREIEAACLRSLLETAPRDLVLAAGGGTPMREDSRRALRVAVAIRLTAREETLRARIRADSTARPPLLPADREPIFRALADATVDTDALTLEETAAALQTAAAPLRELEDFRWSRSAADASGSESRKEP